MAAVPSGTVYLGKAGFKKSDYNWHEPFTTRISFNGTDGAPVNSGIDSPSIAGPAYAGRNYDASAFVTAPTSAKYTLKAGDENSIDAWGSTVGIRRFSKGDTVWFAACFKFSEGFMFSKADLSGGGRMKLMRLAVYDPLERRPNGRAGHIDIYVPQPPNPGALTFNYELETDSGYDWRVCGTQEDDGLSFDGPKPFEQIQYEVTLDTIPVDDGGLAQAKIWMGDKLLRHVTDCRTLFRDECLVDIAEVFSVFNGGSPQDQHCNVDEIQITNVRPSGVDQFGNSKIEDPTNA